MAGRWTKQWAHSSGVPRIFRFIPHLALRVRSSALIPKTRNLSPPLPVSSTGREQAQAAVNAQEWVMERIEVSAVSHPLGKHRSDLQRARPL